MLQGVRDEKDGAQRETNRTRETLMGFDLKLEEYRRELAARMENFDPMEYNLIEKDWFEGEKREMLTVMKDKCR